MEPVTLEWVEKILSKKAEGSRTVDKINGFSTDSRTLKENEIFIALKGENFDGHKFIAEAKANGAKGAVVSDLSELMGITSRKSGKGFPFSQNLPLNSSLYSDESKDGDFFYIKVKDTLDAYQKVAKAYRQTLDLKMINITGSNGKTTTKEMAFSVLSKKYKTYKTEKNFNNEIGVPQSLLALDKSCECAVIELGMTHKGDILKLIEVTDPDIRVITNIGPSHLLNFACVEEIATAKAEILDLYSKGDTAVVNNDDELVKNSSINFKGKKITFGIKKNADIMAQEILNNSFLLCIGNKNKFKISLPVTGIHNIYNALCAAGIGIAAGIDPGDIAGALSNFDPPPGRMEINKYGGIWVIDDTYNANPVSMKYAIETATDLASNKHIILVLGDMLELGKKEKQFHFEIGEIIAGLNVGYLITCGQLAKNIADGAVENGMPQEHIFSFAESEEVGRHLNELLTGEDLILVKGSRSIKMEKVVEYLKGRLIKE